MREALFFYLHEILRKCTPIRHLMHGDVENMLSLPKTGIFCIAKCVQFRMFLYDILDSRGLILVMERIDKYIKIDVKCERNDYI